MISEEKWQLRWGLPRSKALLLLELLLFIRTSFIHSCGPGRLRKTYQLTSVRRPALHPFLESFLGVLPTDRTSTRERMPKKMSTQAPLTVSVGERRWIWCEACFLDSVVAPGQGKGSAKNEADLVSKIQFSVLESKGIPIAKQHIVIQPCNDQEPDPQLSSALRAEAAANNPVGLWVNVWIQWLPETMHREKVRARGGRYDHIEGSIDRNFMITASVHTGTDSKLLKSRWGTAHQEPPADTDRFALRAIARR